jgi:hypothetical protein
MDLKVELAWDRLADFSAQVIVEIPGKIFQPDTTGIPLQPDKRERSGIDEIRVAVFTLRRRRGGEGLLVVDKAKSRKIQTPPWWKIGV